MGHLFAELKRRNVFRVGIAYLVAGWVVAQIVDVVVEPLLLPQWTATLVIVLLLAGLPITLFLAWAYELTPEGVKKTGEVDSGASITAATGRRLDFMIIAGLVLALGYFVWESRFASAPEAPDTGPAAEASIAVLPFVNMSSDPEQEYFSDGISEELLNLLSRIEGLKVAGRTSSFAFKGKNPSFSEIGATLGVAHVLEGSVRKEGNNIRITAQLVRADDGFHVWSETYDRELTSVFAIQDEIAGKIVDTLRLALMQGNAGNDTHIAVPTAPRVDIAAYDFYLLGQDRLKSRNRATLEEARKYLARAIAADADYAPARIAMAEALILLSDNADSYGDIPQAVATAAARTELDRAMSLDISNARAFAVLGLLESIERNLPGAVLALRRAVDMNPRMAQARAWLGLVLGFSNDREGQLRETAHAVELEPLWPLPAGNYSSLLTALGRVEEARKVLAAPLRFFPDDSGLFRRQASVVWASGQRADAIRDLGDFLTRRSEDRRAATVRESFLARLGEVEESAGAATPFNDTAQAWIAAGRDAALTAEIARNGPFPTRPQDVVSRAGWLALTGDHDQVLELLEPWVADLGSGILSGRADSFVVGPFSRGDGGIATLGLAHALKARGRSDALAQVMRGLEGHAAVLRSLGATELALAYLTANLAILNADMDGAFAALELARAANQADVPWLIDPYFEPLHGDPRWAEFAAAVTALVNAERAKLGLGPWPAPADR